jgi:tRNA nucleotidyltransferase/poly(A) polymerase
MGATDLDAPNARDAALAVARRLKDAGHLALFCGGAVRDRLLGRDPGDYDVATSAPPEASASLFPRAVLVGARFGVVLVPGRFHSVEVATFRDDGLYVDGRHPTEVRYSDPVRDASRRDFTINGLFEDPDTGVILDYVEGRRDIASRLIRAIGDAEARFREDHLRLLRAVRLAVQLNFAIEPATMDALRAQASQVADVSAERVRTELLRILKYGRGRGLRLLSDTGLLQIVLPDVAAMQGISQPARFHPEGDVFVHTCLVLDHIDLSEVTDDRAIDDLLLAGLLHDVAKPPTWSRDADGRIRFSGHDAEGASMTATLLERLRMPRRSIERVADLVASHMKFPNLPHMRPAKLRRFLGAEDFPLHLKLHEADSGASHGDVSLVAFCEDRLGEFAQESVLPPPLLRGRDLLEEGYAAGPRLGRILRWVRDRQLDGEIPNRDEAVRRVREAYPLQASED